LELIDQADLIQTATSIAVVRIPNTSQHDAVQDFILDKLKDTKWEVLAACFQQEK